MKQDLHPNWYQPQYPTHLARERLYHTTGVYTPYSLWTAVWLFLCPTWIRTVKELWEGAYGFLSLSRTGIINITILGSFHDNVGKSGYECFTFLSCVLLTLLVTKLIFKRADLDDVTFPTSTLYILKNDKLEVPCEKPKGSPVPSINWRLKDGQALKTLRSSKFSKQGCCTLEKNRTKIIDTGNYTCVATNGFVTKSKTIQIVASGKLNNTTYLYYF